MMDIINRNNKQVTQRLRSQARNIKLRLHQLFPKEVCKKHQKRNNKIAYCKVKQREINSIPSKISTQCDNIEKAYCDEKPFLEKRLRLNEHFSCYEIEQILDDKHYYFGDEQMYRKILFPKRQTSPSPNPAAPNSTPQPRLPFKSLFVKCPSPISHQQSMHLAQVRKAIIDRQSHKKLSQSHNKKEARIKKYMSIMEDFKEKYKEERKGDTDGKLEAAKKRIQQGERRKVEEKQLVKIEKELKQICWNRSDQNTRRLSVRDLR